MSRLPLFAACTVLATTFVGCSKFNSVAVPGSGQIESGASSLTAAVE